jgi:ABC-type transporter Mla maintaining outer membrane lipid asymmetry ATPase subunit MlaF
MAISKDSLRTRTADMQGAANSPLLRIRDVAKTFGRNQVLRSISLEVAEGEFLTILGESG